MSTIWTPGMVDTGGLTDRLLVLGPRGFLATSDTVLFEKAWLAKFNMHVGSIHGVGYPTNDVRLMTKVATEAVNRLFRSGYKYSKAEILLMDLRQPGEFTDDLFAHSQPVIAGKVVGVLDESIVAGERECCV